MKALVLAGQYAQIKLINELKSRGYYVVLADYTKEPVAKKYADKFYRTSTLDIDAIREIAKTEEVDFLITACTDQALLTVAKVSEDLNLPCYIDYKTALNVTNKAYMKKVFEENDIPSSRHIILAELDENKISHLKYPLIVKPVDCNSSKGVKKVYNFEECKRAFTDAVNFSRTDTAIVEEFVTGIEVSVDIYVEDGKANILAVSKSEKIADDNKFVIFRGGYPVKEADGILEKIEHTAQKIVDAFGLKNTPMLMQALTDGKDLSVLEFSARTGGGVKYILIENASGFDVIKAVVDLTVGKEVHVDGIFPKAKYFMNEFIYCKPGTFDHFEGFEELKNKGVMQDYYLFKAKGAIFDSVENSGDRVGGFTVCADTEEELYKRHNEIVKNIKVICENGEDIMRHDLLTTIE